MDGRRQTFSIYIIVIKHYGHPTHFMPLRLYLPIYVRQ